LEFVLAQILGAQQAAHEFYGISSPGARTRWPTFGH